MKASNLYHAAERLNCAQAVLKFHQSELDITDEEIVANGSNGGGMAPQGLCGAIYAAATQLETEEEQTKALEMFKEKAGYLDCRSIRINKTIPCKACVDLASDILTEITENKSELV